MQRHGHRRLGDPRVTIGDGDGMFLMEADQHLRISIAEVIGDRIMKAAVARTGHQRDIFEVKAANHLGHHVGPPSHARVSQFFGLIDRRRRCGGPPAFAPWGGWSCCHGGLCLPLWNLLDYLD